MPAECRNELPLPNRRVFVSRQRGPESGWPVVIDWRRDGSDVTMIQREEAEALARVIRAELHTIPTDCQDAARTLAREMALDRPRAGIVIRLVEGERRQRRQFPPPCRREHRAGPTPPRGPRLARLRTPSVCRLAAAFAMTERCATQPATTLEQSVPTRTRLADGTTLDGSVKHVAWTGAYILGETSGVISGESCTVAFLLPQGHRVSNRCVVKGVEPGLGFDVRFVSA